MAFVAVGDTVTLHCCIKLVNCDVSDVIACIIVSMSARNCLLVAFSDGLFVVVLIVLAFCCSAIRRSSSFNMPMRLSKLLQWSKSWDIVVLSELVVLIVELLDVPPARWCV